MSIVSNLHESVHCPIFKPHTHSQYNSFPCVHVYLYMYTQKEDLWDWRHYSSINIQVDSAGSSRLELCQNSLSHLSLSPPQPSTTLCPRGRCQGAAMQISHPAPTWCPSLCNPHRTPRSRVRAARTTEALPPCATTKTTRTTQARDKEVDRASSKVEEEGEDRTLKLVWMLYLPSQKNQRQRKQAEELTWKAQTDRHRGYKRRPTQTWDTKSPLLLVVLF